MLRYENTFTPEKIKFRLNEIKAKLEIETRIKTGSENMVAAISRMGGGEQNEKRKLELHNLLLLSKAKEQLLTKAKVRYTNIYVAQDEDIEDPYALIGI